MTVTFNDICNRLTYQGEPLAHCAICGSVPTVNSVASQRAAPTTTVQCGCGNKIHGAFSIQQALRAWARLQTITAECAESLHPCSCGDRPRLKHHHCGFEVSCCKAVVADGLDAVARKWNYAEGIDTKSPEHLEELGIHHIAKCGHCGSTPTFHYDASVQRAGIATVKCCCGGQVEGNDPTDTVSRWNTMQPTAREIAATTCPVCSRRPTLTAKRFAAGYLYEVRCHNPKNSCSKESTYGNSPRVAWATWKDLVQNTVLPPCPGCADIAMLGYKTLDQGRSFVYWVYCPNCRKTTPQFYSKKAAHEAWWAIIRQNSKAREPAAKKEKYLVCPRCAAAPQISKAHDGTQRFRVECSKLCTNSKGTKLIHTSWHESETAAWKAWTYQVGGNKKKQDAPEVIITWRDKDDAGVTTLVCWCPECGQEQKQRYSYLQESNNRGATTLCCHNCKTEFRVPFARQAGGLLCPECGGKPKETQSHDSVFIQCRTCKDPYVTTEKQANKAAAWRAWAKLVSTWHIQKKAVEAVDKLVCPACGAEPIQYIECDAVAQNLCYHWIRCRNPVCCAAGLSTQPFGTKTKARAAWRKIVAEYQTKKDEQPTHKTPTHKIAFVCLFCNRTWWSSDKPNNCPNCSGTGIVTTELQKDGGIVCPGCGKARPRIFQYNTACPYCGHIDKTKQQSKTQEDVMNDISNSFNQTNTVAATLVKAGAKQAIGVAAEKAIMVQVKKMLGDQFPNEFYATPLGEAVMDLGACYLVQFATRAFPQMPAAEEVRGYAEHAMIGVSAKSFAPLMEMAQELFTGIADQAKLAGLQKPEDEK